MAKDPTRRKLGEHLELLPVKLTDSELLDRAKKMGHVHNELERHLSEVDELKKEFKSKETKLEEERQLLAHVLFTGAEPREIKVEAWADFSMNRFLEIRSDTGEVIHKRPLRPEEKQGDFSDFDEEDWAKQLHLRLVEAEEAARRRAGDVEKEDADG